MTVFELAHFCRATQRARLLLPALVASLNRSRCLEFFPGDPKHATKIRHAVQNSPPVAGAAGECEDEWLPLIVANKARMLGLLPVSWTRS